MPGLPVLRRPRGDAAAPPRRCTRCGADAEPGQEYCLHCGARLPEPERAPGALETALDRLPWGAGDWLLPAIALLLAAIAGVAIAFGARAARRDATPTLVASSATATVPLAPTTVPAPTTHQTPTAPTITTATLPTAPGAPSTTAQTTPPPTSVPSRPPAHGVIGWPHGQAGWTDILESLPESGGRAAALARARDAARAGMPQVGVLLSSDYSTLRAGYWVVFSGVYASLAAAEDGLGTAHAHGFSGAYPAHVAP